MSQRQRFTREFKLEAVRLLEQTDKPIAELARELGIRRNLLYKWQQTLSSKGEVLKGPDTISECESRSTHRFGK